MSNPASSPGFFGAIVLHAIALGALLLAGAKESPDVVTDADPILLMLGGEDPNKDAGLVGRERGVARGTQDGKIFEPTNDNTSELDAIRRRNEQLARQEAEAARRAAEAAQKQQARLEEERRKLEAARAREQASRRQTPKPATPPANASGGTSSEKQSGQTVSIKKILAEQGNRGGNQSRPAGRGGRRVGEVSIGGGNTFGRPDGTGGNGGDGGRRVADARITYVKAVRERFVIYYNEIIDEEPPSIQETVSVRARFSVSKNGEIRFLEIEGSSNPQIRECIRKAFSRAFPRRFQSPPNGEAFTGCLEGIEFLR